MKTFNFKTLALTTAVASVFFAGSAMAQNVVTVPVNATVQNAITLTLVSPLEFGTVLAINDATETASMEVDSASAVTFAATAAPAVMGQASGTPAAAEVSVAGVSGATINLTIDTVVDPVNGGDSFTLDGFLMDINGAGKAAVTVGTPVPYTATALDTVLIGATITTPTQPALMADGAYAGSFELTASY
jgi:hypothetical protein